jgi:hypothetical protein
LGKHFQVFLLLGIFALFTIGCDNSSLRNKTYVSEDGAICFQYPEDWEVTDLIFSSLGASSERVFCPVSKNSRTNISLFIEKHEG